MNYKRKSPLDYKDIAENLRNPAWYDLENGTDLLDDGSVAITDLLARAEAAEARAEKAEKCIAGIEEALKFGRYSAAMLRIFEYRGQKEAQHEEH